VIRGVLAAASAALVLSLGAPAAFGGATYQWPLIQERAFIANCNRTSGGMGAYCRCELRWLEARYTFRQISALYLSGGTQLRRVVLRSAAACLR
jgi:hypothetical protein